MNDDDATTTAQMSNTRPNGVALLRGHPQRSFQKRATKQRSGFSLRRQRILQTNLLRPRHPAVGLEPNRRRTSQLCATSARSRGANLEDLHASPNNMRSRLTPRNTGRCLGHKMELKGFEYELVQRAAGHPQCKACTSRHLTTHEI